MGSIVRFIRSNRTALFSVLFVGFARANLSFGDGIPEPGLISYGAVSNLGNQGVSSGSLIWSIRSDSSDSITTTSRWITVNSGKSFYIAEIAFETRSVAGVSFAPKPGTLELKSTPASYTRAATFAGKPAAIISSSRNTLGTFTFGSADRGLVERADLVVDLPGETFEQWILKFSAIPEAQRGRGADPDGDGMSNEQEFKAGTDPSRKDSVFEFIGIRPESVGITLIWSSVPGKTYTIERASSLGDAFRIVQTLFPAAAIGERTSFRDLGATGLGPYFYRLRAD